MGEEVIAVARFDYTANQDSELTIQKHDKLIVLESSSSWWRVENENHICGYVPSNYIEKVDKYKESFFDKYFRRRKKTVTSSKQSLTEPPPPALLNIQATVKFNFEASRPDELNLLKGEKVLVLVKQKDGWWKGEKDGQTGYFPSNFVCEGDIGPPPDHAPTPPVQTIAPHPPTNNGATTQQQCIFDPDDHWDFVCGVRAKDTCEAASPNDLSFVIGELMDIVRNPTDEPKWIARKSSGQVGFVLRHMVDIVPNAVPVYFNPKQQPPPSPPLPPPDFPRLQPVQNDNDYVSPFKGKPWYFGVMSRRSCDNLLLAIGKEGDYLVRDSESKVGDYSISLKAGSKPKHFKVQLIDSQYAIGNRRFSTIEEILRHYTHKSPIFTSPGGDERLFLVKPLEQKPKKNEYLCAWEK